MKWKPDFEETYDELIMTPLMRSYFGAEGYFNAGYWDVGVTNPADASRTLTDRLIAEIPTAGFVADVGCGLGATTRRLAELRPLARVLAVNFSLRQLVTCGANCPAAERVQMDAACLGLASGSLDAIISVEAAFHFYTRVDFLREAARTLKAGGFLSMADVLFSPAGWPGSFTVPEENSLSDPDDYRQLLTSAGFEGIRIEDATEKCWGGFCDGQNAWSQVSALFDDAKRRWWQEYLVRLRRGVTHYLLITARTRSLA